MKKEKINELLQYTKSKKVLRIMFLFNDEELLNEVVNIYKSLYNTNRTDSQKSDLVVSFIRNRKRNHIKTLVCGSLITNNYTFQEQKKAIEKYVSKEENYEQIINECYINSMNDVSKKEEKTPIKSTYLITSNKNVLKNRSNQEMHKLLEIYSKVNTSEVINIIINNDVLEHRNNYEHIKLLNTYINNPFKRVYDLIVDSNILKIKTVHEQLKLIDVYLDNKDEITYKQIKDSINSKLLYESLNLEMSKKVENEVKTYRKRINK